DAWITIAVDTEEAWRGLCHVAGHPEWASDGRFADMCQRLRNRKELNAVISEWTRNEDAYALMERLQAEGVAAMPVMNIQDLYFNPHHLARQAFVETNHPLVGVEPIYGMPWKLSKTPGHIRRVAPSVGEHNEYVYQALLAIPGETARSLEEQKVFW
ncbi:MAG: CoA transferase, partial [Chloroflexota bacterium]